MLTSSVLLAMVTTPLATPESSPTKALSERERQVAIGIALGKTVSDIAKELNVSVKSVSTYRTRLCRKLDLQSGPGHRRETNDDISDYTVQQYWVEARPL